MKRSSKPKFDNILLKRWLLKVGPVRRKILLTKFRADLVRLGLSTFAWRKGLLQLSSRPFVRLIKEVTPQITRNGHSDKNNNKDFLRQEFNHATNSSCRKHSKNDRRDLYKLDLTDHPERRTSSVAFDGSKKLVKTEKSERICSVATHRSKSKHELKRKRKRWIPMEGDNPNGITWRLIALDMGRPLGLPSTRSLHLKAVEKRKKKERLHAKFVEIFGEDIDPPESDSPASRTSKAPTPENTNVNNERVETQERTETLVRKSPTFSNQGKKKRREDHAVDSGKKLKTASDATRRDSIRDSIASASDNASTEPGKHTEEVVFPNVLIPPESPSSSPASKILESFSQAQPNSGGYIKSGTNSQASGATKKNENSIGSASAADNKRKFLSFTVEATTNRIKKPNTRAVPREEKTLVELELAKDKKSKVPSVSADTSCGEPKRLTKESHPKNRNPSSSYSREEIIKALQNDTLITNSVDSLPRYQMTFIPADTAVDEFDTDSHTTICTANETDDTEKGGDSSSRKDCERREETLIDTLDSGLTSRTDDELSVATDASLSSLETLPVTRQQSVIVKFDKKRGGSVQASLNKSARIPQLESVINQNNADFTLEIDTANSNVPDDGISTSKVAADNTRSEEKHLPETRTLSSGRKLKNEPADHFNPPEISSNGSLPDTLDNDPNPSSTTDTESSNKLASGMLCISNRLLGALDNIYLALHCRRRVREREQTASRLAIMRNRQEEVLKAKHEFESKLIIFREELSYLFSRLDTWDRVLRFIAQGLDHRTPAGITPFSAAEVELAMLEAEVKVPRGISDKKPSPVPKLRSVGQVLCTIDLTADNIDNVMIDPCDSSTDPPRTQNHMKVKPKSEFSGDFVDVSWRHDLNANEIQIVLPSIEEVKTISPQQFEKIGEKPESSSTGDEYPCYLCSRTSLVACGQCTKATYCSKACQEAHWEQSHHATCVPIAGIIHSQK